MEAYVREFRSNPRLLFGFTVCKDLGIDDPTYWMAVVGDKIVDQWQAYYQVIGEMKQGDDKKDPEQVFGPMVEQWSKKNESAR